MKRERSYLIQSFEEEWSCPITNMPMIQPVLTLDGHCYDKKDIVQWFQKKKTSPKTGLPLSSTQLIPNIVLKNVINRFQKQLKYEYSKIVNENQELSYKIEQSRLKIKELVKQKIKAQEGLQQMKEAYDNLLRHSKILVDAYGESKKQIQILKSQNEKLRRNKKTKAQHTHSKLIQTLRAEIQKTKFQSEVKDKQIQAQKSKAEEQLCAKLQTIQIVISLKEDMDNLKAQNQELKNVMRSLENKPQPNLPQVRKQIKSYNEPQMRKAEEKPNNIKLSLPFSDYLLISPVLYDEENAYLDHSGLKIDVEEFLKYSWTELRSLNLSDSQLDSKGFELLASEACHFHLLENLELCNNLIQKVPHSCLDSFMSLKKVIFSSQNSFPNPLDQQSIAYLQTFQKANPSVQVKYARLP